MQNERFGERGNCVEKRLLSTISAVAVVTLSAKILGFIREAVQASQFGTDSLTDLYTSAGNATTYLFTTAAYALCVAAVPILTKKIASDRAEGFRAAGNLLCIVFCFSVLLTAVGLLIPWSPLFAGPLDPESHGTLLLFTKIFMLSLPVISSTYLILAVLLSMEHYLIQGSLSLPYNLLLILFLLFAGRQYGLTGFACAVSGAWLLQLGVTLPLLKKERFRLRLSFDLRQPYVASFFRTAGVTVVTTAVYMFCYLTDARFAYGGGAGTATAYYYADKLFTPLATTLVYSISTVLFPKLNLYYMKSRENYRSYVWDITERSVMLILPLSILFSVFATPMVRVLFETGNFDRASTMQTGGILAAYSLGMMGFGLLDLLGKAYFTMQRVIAPFLTSLGVIVLNLGCNFAFSGMEGGFGFAWSTSLTLTLGAILLAAAFFRGSPCWRPGLLRILKAAAAAAVTGAALHFISPYFISLQDERLLLAFKCALLGIAGLILYLSLCALLGERGLWNDIRGRVGNK